MKKIALLLPVALLLTALPCAAQGPLSPPGPPAPTMKTLEEIHQQLLATQQRLADVEARLDASGITGTPTGMVLIPAGSFVMGDTFGEGDSDELPLHVVTLSAFYMGKHEVTSNLWGEVYTWAVANGYKFVSPGTADRVDHPIDTVSWHDSLAWVNARSQRDSLTPCYTNANGTYYTNSMVAFAGGCNWSAGGYRLPTEAEWEYAARGGAANRRFPWSETNHISHSRANYRAIGGESYDDSAGAGYHPTGSAPGPVGTFEPNGYGLYDMTGNVSEWCWDRFSGAYYFISTGSDPRGPGMGSQRVIRGGAYYSHAQFCRVASRSDYSPNSPNIAIGFRVVLPAGQ